MMLAMMVTVLHAILIPFRLAGQRRHSSPSGQYCQRYTVIANFESLSQLKHSRSRRDVVFFSFLAKLSTRSALLVLFIPPPTRRVAEGILFYNRNFFFFLLPIAA